MSSHSNKVLIMLYLTFSNMLIICAKERLGCSLTSPLSVRQNQTPSLKLVNAVERKFLSNAKRRKQIYIKGR